MKLNTPTIYASHHRTIIDPDLRQAMGPGYQVTILSEDILRLLPSEESSSHQASFASHRAA